MKEKKIKFKSSKEGNYPVLSHGTPHVLQAEPKLIAPSEFDKIPYRRLSARERVSKEEGLSSQELKQKIKEFLEKKKKAQKRGEKDFFFWLVDGFFPKTAFLRIFIDENINPEKPEEEEFLKEFVRNGGNFQYCEENFNQDLSVYTPEKKHEVPLHVSRAFVETVFLQAGALVLKDTQVQLTTLKKELRAALDRSGSDPNSEKSKQINSFIDCLSSFFSSPFTFQKDEKQKIEKIIRKHFGLNNEQEVTVEAHFCGAVANTAFVTFKNKEDKQQELIMKYKRPGLTDQELIDEALFLKMNIQFQERYDRLKEIRLQVQVPVEVSNLLDNQKNSYWNKLEKDDISINALDPTYSKKLKELEEGNKPAPSFILLKKANGMSLKDTFQKMRSGSAELTKKGLIKLRGQLKKIVDNWFKDGLYNEELRYWHMDPHSGNFIYDPVSGQVTIIDFGEVEDMKANYHSMGGHLERTAWLTKRKFLRFTYAAMKQLRILYGKEKGGLEAFKKKWYSKKKKAKYYKIDRDPKDIYFSKYQNLMYLIQSLESSRFIYKQSNQDHAFQMSGEEMKNLLGSKKEQPVEALISKLFSCWFSEKGDLFYEGKAFLKKIEKAARKAVFLLEEFDEAFKVYKEVVKTSPPPSNDSNEEITNPSSRQQQSTLSHQGRANESGTGNVTERNSNGDQTDNDLPERTENGGSPSFTPQGGDDPATAGSFFAGKPFKITFFSLSLLSGLVTLGYLFRSAKEQKRRVELKDQQEPDGEEADLVRSSLLLEEEEA